MYAKLKQHKVELQHVMQTYKQENLDAETAIRQRDAALAEISVSHFFFGKNGDEACVCDIPRGTQYGTDKMLTRITISQIMKFSRIMHVLEDIRQSHSMLSRNVHGHVHEECTYTHIYATHA